MHGVLTIHWLLSSTLTRLILRACTWGRTATSACTLIDEANYSAAVFWYFGKSPRSAGLRWGLLGALFVEDQRAESRRGAKISRGGEPTEGTPRWFWVRGHGDGDAPAAAPLVRAPPPQNLRAGSRPATYRSSTSGTPTRRRSSTAPRARTRSARSLKAGCPRGRSTRLRPASSRRREIVEVARAPGRGRRGRRGGCHVGERRVTFGMDALFLYSFGDVRFNDLTHGPRAHRFVRPVSAVGGRAGADIRPRRPRPSSASGRFQHPLRDLHTCRVLEGRAAWRRHAHDHLHHCAGDVRPPASMQLIIPDAGHFSPAVGGFSSASTTRTSKSEARRFSSGTSKSRPALDKLRVNEVMADDLVTLKLTSVAEIVAALTGATAPFSWRRLAERARRAARVARNYHAAGALLEAAAAPSGSMAGRARKAGRSTGTRARSTPAWKVGDGGVESPSSRCRPQGAEPDGAAGGGAVSAEVDPEARRFRERTNGTAEAALVRARLRPVGAHRDAQADPVQGASITEPAEDAHRHRARRARRHSPVSCSGTPSSCTRTRV